ncbi:MAG: SdrD B-like domain-containing protein, partial [Gammaproteobacteria bacterium]|nr:SdrD B-like domain-containing protein [Gammaproteobacteria bacterium]
PGGFVFSPQDQGVDDTLDSDADVVTGQTVVTTLDPGENDPTWDAGLFQAALQGCTPGFWKNHTEAWVGYSPTDTVGSIFTLPPELADLASTTLVDALGFGGGSGITGAAKILLRAAVAGLLNAASPDVNYPHTELEIISDVNAALASLDRTTIIDLAEGIDGDNNLGCSPTPGQSGGGTGGGPPPGQSFEGLTPGYWKNHTDAWIGHSETDLVGGVFAVPAPSVIDNLANDTLIEALTYKGGSKVQGAAMVLLRSAVAALLNAADPGINYVSSEAQVISNVDNALASLDRGTMLDLAAELDRNNNSGINSTAAAPGLQPDVRLPDLQMPELQAELRFVPRKTRLLANFPNPFNPETWMPYELAKDTAIQIEIYDVRGHMVRTLDLGHRPAGYYVDRAKAAYWDGRNDFGEPVSSGMYLYRLKAEDYSAIRRMLILK